MNSTQEQCIYIYIDDEFSKSSCFHTIYNLKVVRDHRFEGTKKMKQTMNMGPFSLEEITVNTVMPVRARYTGAYLTTRLYSKVARCPRTQTA